MNSNTILGISAFLSCTALLCAYFCELGWKRGHKRGNREGFQEGYQLGRQHAENWWWNAEHDVGEARQKLWQEEDGKEQRWP